MLAAMTAMYSLATAPAGNSPGRRLLSDCNQTEAHVTVIPGLNGKCDAAWEEEGSGALASIVYIIIVVYLFLGVAILCDNAFTDSLEMICSEHGLNLSEDVAGATFMAAGSSAPELATSFVGVFIAKNEVGLGTIIGSAVFNILIIIGSTALLVGEPLQLDWRPVVRDNFFYSISVVILCVCIAFDGEVQWYDALILLLWYVAYVTFMYFNEAFWQLVAPPNPKDSHNNSSEKDVKPPLFVDNIVPSPEAATSTEAGANTEGQNQPDGDQTVEPRVEEGVSQEAVQSVQQGEGDASGSETSPGAGNGNGLETPGSSMVVAEEEDSKDNQDHVKVPLTMVVTQSDTAAGEESAKPKKSRHASFSTGAWRHHDGEDEEENGIADQILMVLSAPWEFMFEWTIPDCHLELLDADDDDDAEVIESLREQVNEEDCEKCSAQLEKQLRARTEPEFEDLTCGQRWFAASFIMSLVWLTLMSYFMVEFILKLGCLWGVSAAVMGLTFLAMGTSIPDALGSIAVARDGEGDMAVSNAVGSNVFDICLGLGLPWFIDTAIVSPGKTFMIQDTSEVIPSIIILLSIIIVLFCTFVASSWQLKPWVGGVLYFVYILFVIYQLIRAAVSGGC